MTPSAKASSQRTRDIGQALVEFALVLPIFLLLVPGLVDVGRLVYINNALAEGAREGARWGSVQGRSNLPATNASSIQSHTLSIVAAVPNPTVTVACQTPLGYVPATCDTGDILTVTITSPVTMFTPVIGNLIGPRTLSATSQMVVNQ